MLSLWFFANTLLWPLNLEIAGLRLGLNIVVVLLAGVLWFSGRQSISRFSGNALLVLCVYAVFSYIAAIYGPCTDKFQKFFLTTPTLYLSIIIGLEVGWQASEQDWKKLQNVSKWILLIAFSAIVLELLIPGFFDANKQKYHLVGAYSGIFNEPSNVAFSLFPCIAVLLLAESRQSRRIGILALLGLFIFSHSSTLVALLFCWIVYRTVVQGTLGRGILIGLGIVLIAMIAVAVDYDALVAPTVNRIVGIVASENTENASSLVYLQGWQDAWANLQRTNGLGLGFNMMGCTPLPDVSARELLAAGNIELNAEDGSVLFGKLVSEAGVVGILFFAIVVWWWMRVEKMIHEHVDGEPPPAILISAAFLFCFVASSLIRSAGYFNGVFLLFVVALAATVKWRRHRILKLRVNDACNSVK